VLEGKGGDLSQYLWSVEIAREIKYNMEQLAGAVPPTIQDHPEIVGMVFEEGISC